MDSTLWNSAFTNMIRQSNQAAWGNWTLDPAIRAGAVGILDPSTASFTPVAMIPDADIVTLKAAEVWGMESSSTHRTESSIDFKGGYKDPSTGTEVNAGLQVAWSFAQQGSIVSNGTSIGREMVDQFGVLLQNQQKWLLDQAKSVGQSSSAGIVQGFGMITQVELCQGSINIGSLNDSSTFSLSGSVDGVNAMTGGGNVSAGVSGSYKDTNESNAFDSHLWPAAANVAADGPIAITYQFASFDGDLIMPRWIMPLSGFTINFDNAHGGTYIGKCTATYNIPGSKDLQTQEVTVSGGYNRSISGIPLGATNLQVVVAFEAGDKFTFRWAAPLGSWLNGQQTIDMKGVWPWGSHATLRT